MTAAGEGIAPVRSGLSILPNGPRFPALAQPACLAGAMQVLELAGGERWMAPHSLGGAPVHLDVRTLIDSVQEAEDRGRIDLLIRWRAARQGSRHDVSLTGGNPLGWPACFRPSPDHIRRCGSRPARSHAR